MAKVLDKKKQSYFELFIPFDEDEKIFFKFNKRITVEDFYKGNTEPDETSYHKDHYPKIKNALLSFTRKEKIDILKKDV